MKLVLKGKGYILGTAKKVVTKAEEASRGHNLANDRLICKIHLH
jgi:hypothetical protein